MFACMHSFDSLPFGVLLNGGLGGGCPSRPCGPRGYSVVPCTCDALLVVCASLWGTGGGVGCSNALRAGPARPSQSKANLQTSTLACYVCVCAWVALYPYVR
eukprot:8277069-Pyramimonas_sp.AAC.1